MKQTLIFIAIITLCHLCHGQANRHLLREGNTAYNKGKYDEAEINYHKALEADTTDFRGQYNLANTLYQQKKYSEAARHYDMALSNPNLTTQQRANALHNKGNSQLKSAIEEGQQNQLSMAIKSYQEALKLAPKNDDTRYNLAYARRLLQQQQQNQNQQGQQQQNQNQQQQQQQQQNQQQQQQQQQNQNQQQQQNQPTPQDNDDQQQQSKPQQQQNQSQTDPRKQDAERMLEAMKNNERQTLREKTKNEQQNIRRRKSSAKDW